MSDISQTFDNIKQHQKNDETTCNLSRWMTDLPNEITKLPINKLAIPGSHNSGSYYLDPTTPMSPGKIILMF